MLVGNYIAYLEVIFRFGEKPYFDPKSKSKNAALAEESARY